jgi:hypothetical protein
MPAPSAAVPGPMQGQPATFVPGASTSQLAPRPRSRPRTPRRHTPPGVMISAPPQSPRHTPTVLIHDDSRGRHPSRRVRTSDAGSRSPSPAIFLPRTSRGRSRSRSWSRPRRRSESPVIVMRPDYSPSRPWSRSRSPRRPERTGPSIYPPPGTMEPVVVQVPQPRSWSGSPRGDVYDDRTREPRRRSRSGDRDRRRLFKRRPRSRSRGGTPPVIVVPPAPVVPAQAPAPQVPFLLPSTAAPPPVMMQHPISAAPALLPDFRRHSRERRGDAPVVVLPSSDRDPERYRDRDPYRPPRYPPYDDRYDRHWGGSPRGYSYRPHSRYGRSRRYSRSPSPRYPRDPPDRRHHRSYSPRSRHHQRSPSYSPNYSGYDSRSMSPSPREHRPYSGRPHGSRGYPRSSRRHPSHYTAGDHGSSSPPLVISRPERRRHSGSRSPPIIVDHPLPSDVHPGSRRRSTLVAPSRGRSRTRSPVAILQGTTRERPSILVHDDTHQPNTRATSVLVPPVSQLAPRRPLN